MRREKEERVTGDFYKNEYNKDYKRIKACGSLSSRLSACSDIFTSNEENTFFVYQNYRSNDNF